MKWLAKIIFFIISSALSGLAIFEIIDNFYKQRYYIVGIYIFAMIMFVSSIIKYVV